jgi:hypothetical protein
MRTPQLLRAELSAVFLPVIFTTARLWTTEADLSEADVQTGKLPKDAELAPQSWLWYEHPVSPNLKAEVQRDAQKEDAMSLARLHELEYARAIAVVNAEGIDAFLTST